MSKFLLLPLLQKTASDRICSSSKKHTKWCSNYILRTIIFLYPCSKTLSNLILRPLKVTLQHWCDWLCKTVADYILLCLTVFLMLSFGVSCYKLGCDRYRNCSSYTIKGFPHWCKTVWIHTNRWIKWKICLTVNCDFLVYISLASLL